MWQWLMTDVTTVAKDVLELNQNRPEKQVYMSLPRPGVSQFFKIFINNTRFNLTDDHIRSLNYLNNLHSIIIPETRNNEQAVEAGEIGQRGAGEDREGRPRDEADHIRDGRGNGEVAGERERARGEQRHSETRQEYVLDGVLHVPVHKGRRGVEDDPRSVHPS